MLDTPPGAYHNAIYFNAAWKSPFDEEKNPKPANFYLADRQQYNGTHDEPDKIHGFYNDGDSIVVGTPLRW